MYRLDVIHAGSSTATETLTTTSAANALQLVRELLARHAGCERVVVTHNGVRLFAVDCRGATER